MDIRSFNTLRRKIFEYKILLDPKLQDTENAITVLQSNIHFNTFKIIHVNPSIMDTSILEENKMEKKLIVIKQEVSDYNT